MTQTQTRRRGGSLGFVVGFAVGIPATIFALSNLESTSVEFLGWQAEVPLWAVIALSLLAGAVIGMGVLLALQARRRRSRRRRQADPAAAEREGEALEPTPAHPTEVSASGHTPDDTALTPADSPDDAGRG